MNFFQPHLFKKIFFTLVAILFVSNTFAFQGTGRIVGKVVDEKGESIIGATVKVVGVTGGASTNIDGAFNISLAAGTYSLDITYISYQPKRITGIVVKAGEVSTLNISLSPSSSQLNEVVIVSTYSKSNTEGLFVKQKNAVNFTNGISAEQITKTPDANVGQSLKRISGISTFDNKYVVVRGISERYNVATLDGTPMPSTDYSRRNFSFELIPSEMIESVLVHKTVTPDLPVGFGGGMIQVNSKDIPTQNFLTLSIGSGYNSQSTGNDFLSNKRGKYDYLGFDDGTRKMATQPLVSTSGKQASSANPFTTADFEQSKSFTNNWGVYNYVAAPGQNLALSFGRAIELKKPENRFGYIAALNYRNSQNIARIENRRDRFMLSQPNIDLFKNGPIGGGKIYSFNSTLGAMLNIGFKSKTNTFSLKNTYSRVFSNVTTNIFGYDEATSELYVGPQYSPAVQRFSVEPDFLSLLQTKLMGEHQVGTYKFAWDLSRTSVDRQRKDMMRRELINRDQLYGNFYTDWFKDAGYTVYPASRQNFNLNQVDYNWNVSLAKTLLKSGPFAGTLKAGYIGFSKDQKNEFLTAYLRPGDINTQLSMNFNLAQYHLPENFGPGKMVYEIDPMGNNGYRGKSTFHSGYVMIDQRFWEKLRLVGGLRVENFNLNMLDDAITSLNNRFDATIEVVKSDFEIEPKWNFLPSFNLTYKIDDKFNLRAAYSQSITRPEFNEASYATNFNSELQADVSGGLVTSTTTTSYDFRAEWFPGVGEIVSVGVFNKDLAKPLELIKLNDLNYNLYYYINAQSANCYGLEFETRKNLGFIQPESTWLSKIIISSNLSLLRSDVIGRRLPFSDKGEGNFINYIGVPDANGIQKVQLNYIPFKQNRPLFGQTPILFNAGIEYSTDKFGINIVHNYSGRKFFILTSSPEANEFEAPFEQTDLQLSGNFLNNKLKVKMNLGNIFNNTNFFYTGENSYNITANGATLKPGYTDDYEAIDIITYKKRMGVNLGFSFSYKF